MLHEKPFEVGETFGATQYFSEQQVADFASLAGDLNPLHHDIKLAQNIGFNDIVISGTQYTAMMMGLVATFVSERSPTLGLECDFKYKKAVFVNETLKVTWTIIDIHHHEKLQGEFIHFECKMFNAKGDVCTLGKSTFLKKDNR